MRHIAAFSAADPSILSCAAFVVGGSRTARGAARPGATLRLVPERPQAVGLLVTEALEVESGPAEGRNSRHRRYIRNWRHRGDIRNWRHRTATRANEPGHHVAAMIADVAVVPDTEVTSGDTVYVLVPEEGDYPAAQVAKSVVKQPGADPAIGVINRCHAGMLAPTADKLLELSVKAP